MATSTGARKSTPRKTARPAAPAPEPQPAAPDEPAPQSNGHLTDGDQQWLDRHTAASGEDRPAAQAETDVEDIPDGAIAVPLGPYGNIVHLMPRNQWPSSALAALHEGNIEYWARKCLVGADYENVWIGLDPNVGEVEAMIAAWQRLTGDDVGKAAVPRGSLRNGRIR